MTDTPLSSTKPYLIRAFYDWIVDNECTPYIIVNANFPDVQVPNEYVDEGRIILNIAMQAVNNLQMTNEFIDFDARFKGISRSIYIPTEAVIAIYAHENGRGMVFAEEVVVKETDHTSQSEVGNVAGKKGINNENKPKVISNSTQNDTPTPPRPRGKPNLKIVK